MSHAHCTSSGRLTLDSLPNAVRPRLQDVASADIVVVEHIRLNEDVRVPGREIDFLLHTDSNLDGTIYPRVLLLRRGRRFGRGLVSGGLDGSDIDLMKGGGALYRKLLHVRVEILAREEEG